MTSAAPRELADAPAVPPERAADSDFADAEVWRRLTESADPAVFAAAWLDLQCRLIPRARAGVVVLGGDSAGYAPAAFWPEGGSGSADLAAAAELALEKGRGVVRRHREQGGDLAALAYPLRPSQGADSTARGVAAVEIIGQSDAELRLAMRQLQWGIAWWQRPEPGADPSPPGLTRVLDLLASALQEDRFIPAATALVTEMAMAFGCDRVSYGSRGGASGRGRTRVRAISHSADFNKKSALVRDIAAAMDEAIDQQEPVLVPPPEGALPLVTRAQQALIDRQGASGVLSLPLNDGGRLVGALTLERAGGDPFDPGEVALIAHAATLVGPILEARRREDRWIGAKLWDALAGFAARLLGPRALTLKVVTLSLLGVLAYLGAATGTYRVNAPATLEGTVQRAITAPLDGYIAEAPARAGDRVAEGALLAALEDKDLRLEQAQWQGEREKFQREYSDALAGGERARVRILGAQVAQAEARLDLIDEQLARTRLLAPFAGILVSGDLSQSLGSPVSRGDVLFELAPLDGYRVVLRVDERDVSALAPGQAGRLALSGLPGEALALTVERITPVAVAEEGRNLFRVEAALDSGTRADLRPGMQGIAKVDIGQRNRLWIWTHKLLHWMRLTWWSWVG